MPEIVEPKKPGTNWWHAALLTFIIGMTSWLTHTVVDLDRASDNGPLMREARNRTDDRNDAQIAADIKDIRDRLGRLESGACR